MRLMRVWRRMPALVHEQADLLRGEVADIFDRQGVAVSQDTHRECLLFILWSVHAGLLNMRAGLPRGVLLWLHRRKVARTARSGDHRLLPLYERRLIEALYVVRNIVAERTAQGWALPLSTRTARMFLKNASPPAGPVQAAMLDDVLAILRRRSSACIGTLLAA